MVILFWIMIFFVSACSFAASLIAEYGTWIFFAGYFCGVGVCAFVRRYQERQKRQGGKQ